MRVRRAQARRLAENGKRLGYGLFLVAIVAFAVAVATEFPAPAVTVVIAALAVGSAVLAPSIVVAYGVRAAEREDRGR